MGQLEVINSESRNLVIASNNVFTVLDTVNYRLKYISNNTLNKIVIFLEDYPIKEYYIDGNSIIITETRLFQDSRGPVDVQINDDFFTFDVKSKKMSYNEIENMILYLYNYDDQLLHSYFSRSKSRTNKINESDTSIPLSAKYIKRINEIIGKYEKWLPNFTIMPHTVIRKMEKISDYGKVAKEYDINWLLMNIDLIDIEANYDNHPDAIILDNEYGWINKIKTYENVISFNNYENRIILSGLNKIKYEILSAIESLEKAISKERVKCQQSTRDENISFSDIKIIPLLKTKKELKNIIDRTHKVILRYKRVFKDIKIGIEQIKFSLPHYTPVFRCLPHYRGIFKEIIWLYNNKYNLSGELDLIGLKKVSDLYEIYCYLQLQDGLHEALLADFYLDGSKFIHKNRRLSIELFFQPKIEYTCKDELSPRLVRIGNYKGSYYKPDFVLEIRKDNDVKYVIMDAKYSRLSTVNKYHMDACSIKYLVDIGICGEEYKKADYLFIINPEKSIDNDISNLFGTKYYPRIGIICIKPNDNDDFKLFIKDLIKCNYRN